METAVKPTALAIWEVILNVPVGKLIAWIVVVASILALIVAATIKLYKVFSKLKDLKTADEEKTKMLQDHDDKISQMVQDNENTIHEIYDRICEIQSALEIQKEVNLKQVRYQIVHTCDDAISLGYISAGKLKSLEELYEEYTRIFKGNGYVKTLMKKVRVLPVVGSLDE